MRKKYKVKQGSYFVLSYFWTYLEEDRSSTNEKKKNWTVYFICIRISNGLLDCYQELG